ncbi:MAG TPA: S8 family serine peptidase, partial [Blastocatellia bacterium]|nr:S8 family serine peptidase [Blastocatellia bacterium]
GAELIQLPAIVFDPSEALPEPPAELAVAEPGGTDTAYYLVQFLAPAERGWVSFIEELGATFVQDAPAQAAVFRMTAAQAAQTAAAREQACVGWVGLYHPAYALSYLLTGRNEPFSARDLRSMAVAPESIPANESGALEVAFFADRTPAEMRPAIEAAGATVKTDTGYSLIIDLPAERLPALLRVSGVFSVEAHIEPQVQNQRAALILATNQVRNLGNVDFLVNLDGSGEIVGVVDTGLDSGTTAAPPGMHPDLAGRILLIANLNGAAITAGDFEPHGTHVTGSIVGDGTAAPAPDAANPNRSRPRGIAPGAQVIFHSVNSAAPPAPTPAIPSPKAPLNFNLFLTAFQNAHNAGARVHSNSWGADSHNVYTSNNTGSGVIDRFAFLRPDSLLLFAASNDENDAANNGTLDQNDLTQEGVCKNVLTSGTAKQGWFHLVSSDAPVHLIAVWHINVAGAMQVRLNRFQLTGAPQAGVAGPIQLTTLAGDSQNAVIAPRPILFDPAFPLPAGATTTVCGVNTASPGNTVLPPPRRGKFASAG